MTESTSPARPVRQERRRRGRIGRVASGAVAVVVLVVGGATPARAEPRSTMAIDPTGDLASPPTASGTFTGPSLLGLPVEKITGVTLAVSPSGPTGGSDVTQNGCDVGTGCDTADVEYTWQIPGLDYNGPYVVNATASYCPVLGCAGAPETTSAEPAQFRLGVDPRAPSDVRVAAGTDRSVVVSWARNGEPDIQHYALFRKDPGGDFRRLGGDIEQPDSGRPTFTDTGVAGTGGGDFTYRVFAVRNGFSGDTSTNRISKASADRATTVPPPPVTTVAPGTDPNAPPVTIAGEGVDISSFLSGQAPALPAPAPVFLDLPDTGFGQTLPFGGLPDEAEPGEADAVLPRTPRERQIAQFQRNRPLIPVAAGAILLVLAGHIRLLNVRTKPTVAPKKLPPGTYVARALEAARSNQVPIDVASAV
ncbi:MAG: hypothetical protein QOI99_730, partial [Actinomycetota bacterium]|nr:hypothetical protein [Actinomycetota bacterium]